MELHQILTGSCNDNIGCLSYGSLLNINFIAYGSGRDIVILNDNFVRNNIILGSKYQINHINLLSCTIKSGNILAINFTKAFIFNPLFNDNIVDLKSINWELISTIDTRDNVINCVSWLPNQSDTVIFGSDHVQLWKMQKEKFSIGDDHLNIEWKCFSSLKLPDNEKVEKLEFSSDGRYFVTLSKNSTKIYVWFCSSNSDFNNIEEINDVNHQNFIDYIVLNHPKPIISFEWRENSTVTPKYYMRNFLLTCCQDNICRIWSETHIMHQYNQIHSSVSKQTKHFKNNVLSNKPIFNLEKISTQYSVIDDYSTITQPIAYPRFILKCAIDNTIDVPLFSNLYHGKSKNVKYPLAMHWLNNKKFSFDKIISEILNHIEHLKLDHSSQEIEHYSRIFLKELQKVTTFNDTVFAFLPIKGSLITWQIHCLDDAVEIFSEDIEHYQASKNSYVTVHSCLPNSIPVADAHSMDSKLLLFSFPSPSNHFTNNSITQNSSPTAPLSFDSKSHSQDIKMISKQQNGSLNLWNLSVLNDSANNVSSILNTKHLSRISGHRWQTHNASCHSQLPLLLTSSNFKGESSGTSDLSELILWRLKGVGPFSEIGGIREVARINSKIPNKFFKLSWFSGSIPSKLFPFSISSPCSLFAASDYHKNQVSVYLSIPEANDLLKQVQKHKEQKADMLLQMEKNEEMGKYEIISLTSTGEPGCVIFLQDLQLSVRSSDVNKQYTTKFLHVYPYDMIMETHTAFLHNSSQSKQPNNDVFEEVYYIVRVLEVMDSVTSSTEDIIEMWRIKLTESKITKSTHQTLSLDELICINIDSEKVSHCTMNNSFGRILELVPTAGHLSSASIYPECLAPYLMATICEDDNSVRFWKCQFDDKNAEDAPSSVSWIEWSMKTAASMSSQIQLPNYQPLHISCAYSGRVAVLYCHNNPAPSPQTTRYNSAKETNMNYPLLVVYECESTGGSEWTIEESIELKEMSSSDEKKMKQIHIDWINSEDGSHLLSLSFNSKIVIYSPTSVDFCNNIATNNTATSNTTTTPTASSSSKFSKWIKIKEINLNRPCSYKKSIIEHVSWAREGLMIVGVDNEIHVYNQWNTSCNLNPNDSCNKDLEKRSDSIRDSLSYQRLEDAYKMSNNMTKAVAQNAERDSKFLSNIGLFEMLQLYNPILPQYHPKQLLEWINFGKIRRVKAILSHLTECICGDTDLLKHNEETSESSSRLEIKAIPPLPLYVLLNIDTDGLSDKQSPTNDKSKLEDNFMDEDDDVNITMTDDLDFSLANDDNVFQNTSSPREISFQKAHKTGSRKEKLSNFSADKANALSTKLQRVQLPGITTLDQIYLLGISEIMSNIKDESIDNRDKTISTKVNAANSLDDCGLRFLLAMQHYCNLCKTLPPNQRNTIKKEGLDLSSIIWGFFSETEGELIKLLHDTTHDNLMWTDFKRYGCGWWIRNDTQLQIVIEKVAKNTFQYTKDPMDAAIFYLAMGKQKLLAKLFKNCNKMSLSDFFSLDFSKEENKNRALNQAYKMRSKRKYEHAISLFLLSDCIHDALLIALFNLKDLQLALSIVRLNKIYKKTKLEFPEILQKQILENSSPFIRSMGYWIMEQYMDSLTTLLQEQPTTNLQESDSRNQNQPINTSPPSDTVVFVFYNFLKYHPLINKFKAIGTWENYAAMERRLYFRTAYKYFKLGCLDLSLEVLSSLPYEIEENPKSDQNSKEPGLSKEPTQNEQLKPENVTSGLLSWDDFEDDLKPPEFKIDFGDNEDNDELVNDELDVLDDNENNNEQQLSTEKIQTNNELDIINLQYKFIICIKLISEEICTLASGIETSGCFLRAHVYEWLEREVKVIHDICFPKADDHNTDQNVASNNTVENNTNHPYQHYLSDLDSNSHRIWLKTNQYLLLSLYNFCSTVSPSNIGLGAIKMELLILLNEIQGSYNEVLQQFRPLPKELKLPFLICSLTPETGIISNPIQQIKASLSDISNIITGFKSPQLFLSIDSIYLSETKTTNTQNTQIQQQQEVDKAHYILNLCQNLSAALYQCLSVYDEDYSSDTEEFDSESKRRKRLSSFSVLYTAEADLHIRSKISKDNEDVYPNSEPKKWPGFASFISIFGLKGKSLNSDYVFVLTEVLVAIYVGMLIYSFKVNDASLIYRLVNVKFDKKLWGKIFGGTLRKKPQRPGPPEHVSPSKRLDTPQHGPTIITQAGETRHLAPPQKPQPPTIDETFIVPISSILDILLEKPIIPIMDTDEKASLYFDFDSDTEDTTGKNADANNLDEFDDDFYDEFGDLNDEYSDAFNFSKECDDFYSYTWCLVKLVALNAVNVNITMVLKLIMIEPQELQIHCPNIFSVLKVLSQWESALKRHLLGLKEFPGAYKDIIKECDSEILLLKKSASNTDKLNVICRVLTEKPFSNIKSKHKPMKRLWTNLIQKTEFQPLFVQNFIHLKDLHQIAEHKKDDSSSQKSDSTDTPNNSSNYSSNINNSQMANSNNANNNNIKIVHKEHEMLYSIAINQNAKSLLVTSTAKEIIELNVENLIDPKKWIDDDYEFLSDLLKDKNKPGLNFTYDFLLDTPTFGTNSLDNDLLSNNNASSKLILKRPIQGAQILKSHPRLPYYLSGNNNGQVSVFEWGIDTPIVKTYAPIQKGKITSLNFHHSGNKFGMGDSEGVISLCHFSYADNTKSHYFQTKCPHKNVLDFCFLNSSSLIATCGGSGVSGISTVNHLHAVGGGISTFDSNSINISVWDVLLPNGRNQIKSYSNTQIAMGVTSLCYVSKYERILVGTRRGDIGYVDLRNNCLSSNFVQAHDNVITSIKLDPLQQYFITSSADGYIKIWHLQTFELLQQYRSEPTKTSVFSKGDIAIKCLDLIDDDKILTCGSDGLIRLRYVNNLIFNINNTNNP